MQCRSRVQNSYTYYEGWETAILTTKHNEATELEGPEPVHKPASNIIYVNQRSNNHAANYNNNKKHNSSRGSCSMFIDKAKI